MIAATNVPWLLDEALRRRFKYRCYIGPPDWAGRRRLIDLELEHRPNTVAPEERDLIATRTARFSCSDISTQFELAADKSVGALRKNTLWKVDDQGCYRVSSGCDGCPAEMNCKCVRCGSVRMSSRAIPRNKIRGFQPLSFASFEGMRQKEEGWTCSSMSAHYEEWDRKYGCLGTSCLLTWR